MAEGGDGGHFTCRLAYDGTHPDFPAHKVTTLTAADGTTTRYLIDDSHLVVGEIDAGGALTRSTYDALGRTVAETDALGRTTGYRYDTAGHLSAVVRPDGSEITVERDEHGNPVRITEPGGGVWRQTWDGRGNRTSLTDPTEAVTCYTHDDRGGLLSVTDPLGATTQVRCDATGLPVEITDPLGATARVQRDVFGRVAAETDSLGAVTRYEWSVEGLLLRRTGPDGASESWMYDGEGNCTAHTSPTGAVTRFAYGHFDQLTTRTDPDGARYEFTHDAELRLTQVTNPQGLTWTYRYDPAGHLIAETDFDGRTVHYERDAAGRMTARTTPLSQTIHYTYDALDQLVRQDANGHVTHFTYDPNGNLLRAAGLDTELTRSYDPAGRLVTETVDGRTLHLAYDPTGKLTARHTPSGVESTYAYDAAGNRTGLTTAGRTVAFTHDAAGRETARGWASGLSLNSAWDPTGRLLGRHLTGPGGRTVLQRTYTWRADGHLTATGDRHYALDPAGRVTAVQQIGAEGWTESYAYDTAGNQTQAAWPGTHPGADATGPRTYTGTRLTSAGSVHHEYDAAGRTTLRRRTRLSHKPDVWRYTWDAEDHLTTVVTPDGTVWCYRYDALGRRIAKRRLASDDRTVTEETRFTWHGATLIEQISTCTDWTGEQTLTWDHDEAGLTPLTQTDRYAPAANAPQSEIDTRFYAIVTDLVGTPTELVDETGEIAWQQRSTLWGITTWNPNANAYTPLRFPGQYHDLETGHHYNVHRHYDPETGRYLSPDPLGLVPAPNPTTYGHNPHTWVDPEGLAPCRQAVADDFNVLRRAVINPRRVFRGDARHPDEIFRNGFAPKGANEDIGRYALHDTPSNWVGASKSASQAGNFPQSARGRGTWVYEIRGNGYGVDVNRALGGAVRSFIRGTGFPSEREVIFRSIDPSKIVRAERWRYGMRTGEIIKNLGFIK